MPPLRKLDLSRDLTVTARLHRPTKFVVKGMTQILCGTRNDFVAVDDSTMPISREVINGVDGDYWGGFETVETFRHEIKPKFSIADPTTLRPLDELVKPASGGSFFALREGEKPRRKKKS